MLPTINQEDDVIDIYCDASVGKQLRGACSGCLIVDRQTQDTSFMARIQPEGTNNSGEIAAIALGVVAAIQWNYKRYALQLPPYRVNLFSDSMISISGVRQWIFDWMNHRKGDILYKSDGQPVMNQNYIKLIYNQILTHRLRIRFYHQKGHVKTNMTYASHVFYKSNGVTPESIGVSSGAICAYNDYVDNTTREIIFEYLRSGSTSGHEIDDGFLGILGETIWDKSPEGLEIYRGLISP